MNQIQDFFPRKVIAPVEATVHLANEFQVFGSIHRPTVIAEVGGVMQEGNTTAMWGNAIFQTAVDSIKFNAFVKIRHSMFAMLRCDRFRPGFLQRLEGADFHI